MSSAEVIDAFDKEYEDEMKALVAKYGHRDDDPKKNERGQFYAASTYIADRLSTMKRMGLVELKHTLDFDHKRWPYLKRMGTWRLIRRPLAGFDEGSRTVTFRLPEPAYAKLAARAEAKDVSVANKTAEIVLAYLDR